ncbi:hypothetical protein [Caldanaerobacter subterraneus]|uniref:Uncharacterized protein n=1 Tax=Caldanaerobacter subterraneus TaxID=911092 RepID=A0A7Y2PKZ8_9THEO|nr:hypothetical protein [Caldanaerobacter subterraneus]NNG67539.1 hypothetical protein [Caldanaerobacter subterraneus]
MYREVAVTYYLNEKGRKDAILKGMDGKVRQTILVPVTPELLEVAEVDSEGDIIVNVCTKKVYKVREISKNLDLSVPVDDTVYSVRTYVMNYPVLSSEEETIYFDHVPDKEEMYEFILRKYKEEKENYEKAKAELETKLKEFEENILPQLISKEKEKLQKKILEEQIEKEKKQKELEEKKEWIEKYGSEYLKKAFAQGFDCQRLYVKERAAKEFPGFIVDFDDRVSWKERSCPSEQALEEMIKLKEKGYDADVVWVTWVPADLQGEDEEYYEFEEQEAVVIRNYLGKYDLIKLY